MTENASTSGDDASGQSSSYPTLTELTTPKLGELIDRRLRQTEFAESAITPVTDVEDARETVVRRLRDSLPEVDQTRKGLAEAKAELAALVKRFNLRSNIVAAIGLVLALTALADRVIPVRSQVHLRHLMAFFAPSGRVTALLLLGILLVATALYARWWAPHGSPPSLQVDRLSSRDLELTGQLETNLDLEIDRLLRLAINEEGERLGTLVLTPDAPALVEMETAETASTPNIERLRGLVRHSATSAFAIAGPRGIGKSTLIRALAADRALFDAAAVVPAPVRYDPDALLRRIHAELAMAILRRRDAETALADLEQRAVFFANRRRLRMAGLAFGIGFGMVFFDLLSFTGFGQLGPLGTLGAFLAFAAIVLFLNPPGGRPTTRRSPETVVGNALDALELIRYTTEATSTNKTTFGSAKLFFGTDDAEASTRRERERSRPELVADLVAFLHRHLTLARREDPDIPNPLPIAIAVDELDKMADPGEILETINSLKDLFRIPAVHFLVSVSTDAIDRFSLRGVVSRDAFDSSFDAVIELDRLQSDQSHEILSARAVGFPRSLSAVAHGWSGGLPRDLIRVARRCVELRRDQSTLSITHLSAIVIAEDLRHSLEALRVMETAAVNRTSSESPSSMTALIDTLAQEPDEDMTSARLMELLVGHAGRLSGVDKSARAASVKITIAAILTTAMASGIADAKLDDPLGNAAELARVVARMDQPLGEFLVVAGRVRDHLRAKEVEVPSFTFVLHGGMPMDWEEYRR